MKGFVYRYHSMPQPQNQETNIFFQGIYIIFVVTLIIKLDTARLVSSPSGFLEKTNRFAKEHNFKCFLRRKYIKSLNNFLQLFSIIKSEIFFHSCNIYIVKQAIKWHPNFPTSPVRTIPSTSLHIFLSYFTTSEFIFRAYFVTLLISPLTVQGLLILYKCVLFPEGLNNTGIKMPRLIK